MQERPGRRQPARPHRDDISTRSNPPNYWQKRCRLVTTIGLEKLFLSHRTLGNKGKPQKDTVSSQKKSSKLLYAWEHVVVRREVCLPNGHSMARIVLPRLRKDSPHGCRPPRPLAGLPRPPHCHHQAQRPG